MKTANSGNRLNPRRTSIKRRFLVFSVALFLVILAGGGIAFSLSMGQIIRNSAAQELSRLVETRRLRLEGQVNSEIVLAIKMAGSPLIQEYFLHPEDADLERLAFDEIAGYRRAFTGNTVFWISDIDKKFYSDDAYSYTVNPENPADYWYNGQ
jgi:methyl-accepting chemotaxis protein